MAEALAILSAIENCKSIAMEIYNIIRAIRDCPRDIKDIGERFGVDNAMLSRLLGFFQRYRKQLASDLYDSIASATHSLKEKLWTLRSRLRPVEAGMTWKRIAWRVKKGDVISAANDLERWTVRLSLLVNLLPAQLREVLALDFASVDFNADGRRSSLLQSLLMKQQHEKDLGRTLADFRSLQCRPDYGDQRIREYDGESWMMLMTGYMRRTGLKKLIELDMARLVSLLSRSDVRTMHLPEALCYYEKPTEVSNSYVLLNMVYRKPQNVHQTCSLSWLLKQCFTRVCQTCCRPVRGPSGMRTSLTQRVDLARDITSAVAFLHSTGWVHKNIRTQRIMLCRYTGQKQFSLSSVTVAGFSFSRYCEDEAHSLGADGGNWRSDIYKHPERQDEYIDTDPRPLFDAGEVSNKGLVHFTYRHDLYSLGVVLLEIGLWQLLETSLPELKKASPWKRRKLLLRKVTDLQELAGYRYARIVRRCLEIDDDGDLNAQEVLRYLEEEIKV